MSAPSPGTPFYQDERITIYRGDCRKIAPLLEPVDLLLTDPPYGIGVCSRGTIGSDPVRGSRRRHVARGARCTRFTPVTWDSAPPPGWLLQMLISRARQAVLWGGNYYRDIGPSSCWLVWDKRVPTGVGFADAELAWTSFRRAVRMFRWRWSGMLQEDMSNKEERVHPTQKPVSLMIWCIGLARQVRSLLDPFMGSGSSLIAADRLGITAVGIDQSEEYCAAAVRRLAEDRERRLREPHVTRCLRETRQGRGGALRSPAHPDPLHQLAPRHPRVPSATRCRRAAGPDRDCSA